MEKKISAVVPEDMAAQLERLAREHERSLSGEVRLALSAHLRAAGSAPVARITRQQEGGRA